MSSSQARGGGQPSDGRGSYSPQDSSPANIINDILGSLEPERSKLIIVPLEIGEKDGATAGVAKKVSKNKGLKEEARKAFEATNRNEEVL